MVIEYQYTFSNQRRAEYNVFLKSSSNYRFASDSLVASSSNFWQRCIYWVQWCLSLSAASAWKSYLHTLIYNARRSINVNKFKKTYMPSYRTDFGTDHQFLNHFQSQFTQDNIATRNRNIAMRCALTKFIFDRFNAHVCILLQEPRSKQFTLTGDCRLRALMHSTLHVAFSRCVHQKMSVFDISLNESSLRRKSSSGFMFNILLYYFK